MPAFDIRDLIDVPVPAPHTHKRLSRIWYRNGYHDGVQGLPPIRGEHRSELSNSTRPAYFDGFRDGRAARL
jgi:hypothetical protein